MEETTGVEMLEAEQRLAAAYETKPISLKVKLAKIAAALCVPLGLALVFIFPETDSEIALKQSVIPLIALAFAVRYSVKVWYRDSVMVLATVRHRIKPEDLTNKILMASSVFVFVLFIVIANQSSDAKHDVTPFILTIVPYLLYLGFLLWPQYHEALTPAAKEEYARIKFAEEQTKLQQQARKAEPTWIDNVAAKILATWYGRYTLGALLLWFAYALAQQGGRDAWIMATTIAIAGLACMKELALWILGLTVGGGLLYLAFGAIAGIPVSVAIIIGALIIANSRNK